MQTSESQTTLTATESALLGLLTEGERSGYDLHKRVDESVGHIWAPAKSHIYAVLPRLVAAGLAKRRDVRQAQRPDKQVYRITTAGREALRAWLHSPPRTNDEFLLKVFFGRLMDREALIALIEARREQARADLAMYRAVEDRIAGDDDAFFGYLTLRFGIARTRAVERWCADALDRIGRRFEA